VPQAKWHKSEGVPEGVAPPDIPKVIRREVETKRQGGTLISGGSSLRGKTETRVLGKTYSCQRVFERDKGTIIGAAQKKSL